MALPPNATEQQIIDFIGQNYGPDVASFLRVPELKSLLIKAGQQQAAPDLVSTWLRRTDWYRKRSESMRTYDALRLADPAEHARLLREKQMDLAVTMGQLGIVGTKAMAEQALRLGLSDTEIKFQFADKLTEQSGGGGLVEDSAVDISADSLMAIARNEYFVPLNKQDANNFAIQIFTGQKSEEQVRAYLSRLAAPRFPNITEQGFTPGEYMAPIRNIIAETLELAPQQVDFLDRRFAPVLEAEGGDGTLRPMTLAEATRWARERPEYQTTKGAQNEAASMVDFIGKTFGAI